jgi:hypothetical protein
MVIINELFGSRDKEFFSKLFPVLNWQGKRRGGDKFFLNALFRVTLTRDETSQTKRRNCISYKMMSLNSIIYYFIYLSIGDLWFFHSVFNVLRNSSKFFIRNSSFFYTK